MKKLIALAAVMGLGTYLLMMCDSDKKKKTKKVKKTFGEFAHKAKEAMAE